MSSWLFLSPHLDDAVLSCGGLIARLSGLHAVTVATVFASAPWCGPYSHMAKWLHSISGFRNAGWLARARRREDAAACGRLGAGYVHLKWYDAVYRRSSNGFLYSDVIQTDPVAEDEFLIGTLAAEIHRRSEGVDYLVVPLGIGRHVDHLIVRQAAERTGRRLVYYAEIPYLWLHSGDLFGNANVLKSIEYCVDDEFAASWIAAAFDYRSQLRMLNEAASPLDHRLREYAAGGLALYTNSLVGGLDFQ